MAQRSKAQAKLAAATAERSNADSRLTREIQHHKDSLREHTTRWTNAAKAADTKAAGAAHAHELLRQLPGAVALGAAGLCEIAAKLTPLEPEQQFDADEVAETRMAAQP